VTAPTLVGVEQLLAEDEFGRVVELTFSEAMDPWFSTRVSGFSAPGDDGATQLPQLVTQPSPDRLRLRFGTPIVPGVDQVSTFDLVDAHGNAFPSGPQAVVAGSTVANAYANPPEVRTVEGVGGDEVVVETVQALDPESAEDPAHWTLTIDGAPIDLSGETFTYDLASRTLTFGLPADTTNGLGFDLVPNGPLDVDGEAFAVAANGTVAGDATAPTVVGALQNRTTDPTGRTVDVTFSEDVEESGAEVPGHWSAAGGPSVTSATRLADERVVRLVLDAPAVPGDVTLGVSSVADPAGNVVQPAAGIAVQSDDTTAPTMTAAAGTGNEGLDNDTLAVTFDDLMVPADVTDPGAWAVQSPVGTPLDTTGASVVWDAATRTATLTFDAGNGIDFQVGDSFRVELVGVRDLGGNTLGGAAFTGDVDVERDLPTIDSIFVLDPPGEEFVAVLFDEPVAEPDVFVGAELFDSQGQSLGTALSVSRVVNVPRGIALEFAQPVQAGSDVLDLRGVVDVAGNPAFPVSGAAIASQDFASLDLDAPACLATAVSGERNDSLTFTFDRLPSRIGLLDPANYSIELFTSLVEQTLTAASVEYDGDRTVTLTLEGGLSLDAQSDYVLRARNLQTAQGIPVPSAASALVTVGGDLTAPDLAVGRVTVDAQDPRRVRADFSEAMDPTTMGQPSNYLIGVENPTAVQVLGPRTVALDFVSAVSVGATLEVTANDLAGNGAAMTRVIGAPDAVGPALVTAEAVAVPGVGGDFLRLTFDEPLTISSATDTANFTLTVDGTVLDLSTVAIDYRSVGNELRVPLPEGVEFDVNGTVAVRAENLTDMAGNPLAAPIDVGATLTGDAQPPSFEAAGIDLRAGALGQVVLVRFDEAIDATALATPGTYSTSGGAIGAEVEVIDPRTVRVVLSNAPGADETLEVTGLRDLAGNPSGTLAIDPVE
jgi:hypothetical protein